MESLRYTHQQERGTNSPRTNYYYQGKKKNNLTQTSLLSKQGKSSQVRLTNQLPETRCKRERQDQNQAKKKKKQRLIETSALRSTHIHGKGKEGNHRIVCSLNARQKAQYMYRQRKQKTFTISNNKVTTWESVPNTTKKTDLDW